MEMYKKENISQQTMRDYIAVIFKHYKRALSVFLAIFLFVIIATFLAPETYQTEAKLFVRLGSETLNQNSATGQSIQISQTMETQLNSVIQMLQSREMAVNLYNELGRAAFEESGNPYAESNNSWLRRIRSGTNNILSYPRTAVANLLKSDSPNETIIRRKETEAAVQEILKNLKAELVPESNIITLQYEDIYPEKAYDILTNLIDLYMARHIELNHTPGSYEFFKRQSASLNRQLETAEARLTEAKNEIGVSSLEEHRTILSEQIGYLQQKMEETESGIASSGARITTLESKLDNLPENLVVSETTGAAMSAGEEMQRSLYDLKLQEQELLSTFKPESIPVTEIRRQVKEAEMLLDQSEKGRQITTGFNPMHQELEVAMMLENGSLEALRAQQTAIDGQLRNANTKLREINTAEVRLAKLQRQKELLEENYKKYADSLEQVRIDKAKEIQKLSNISIAQAPVIPLEPAHPNKRVNLVLGLFLALFGGLGLAFFLEYLDDTFRKPEEVEKVLELPVLGSIEKLPNDTK